MERRLGGTEGDERRESGKCDQNILYTFMKLLKIKFILKKYFTHIIPHIYYLKPDKIGEMINSCMLFISGGKIDTVNEYYHIIRFMLL